MQSPDEVVRGDFARGLCPCHAGWEVFEQHVGLVFRLLRDPSHVVRAHALHMFEDAAQMMLAEDLRYHLEAGEETNWGEALSISVYGAEVRSKAKRQNQEVSEA